MTGGAAAGIVTLALIVGLFALAEWLFTIDHPAIRAVDRWLDNLLDPPARAGRWRQRRTWWRRHSLEVAAAVAILLAGIGIGHATGPREPLALPAAPETVEQQPSRVRLDVIPDFDQPDHAWDLWVETLKAERLLPDDPDDEQLEGAWRLAIGWCNTLAVAPVERILEAIATTSSERALDARLLAAAEQTVCGGQQ